jgi:hypothetical protein
MQNGLQSRGMTEGGRMQTRNRDRESKLLKGNNEHLSEIRNVEASTNFGD